MTESLPERPIELPPLPCPFCGGPPEVDGKSDWVNVRCLDCGVVGPSRGWDDGEDQDQLDAAESEAIAAWNRRAAVAVAQKQDERDAERLDWLDAQWQDGVHVEVCAAADGRSADSLSRAATVYTRTNHPPRTATVREAIDAAMRSGA